MDFLNKRAILVASMLVAIMLAAGVWFLTEAFYDYWKKEKAAIFLGAFLIFAGQRVIYLGALYPETSYIFRVSLSTST